MAELKLTNEDAVAILQTIKMTCHPCYTEQLALDMAISSLRNLDELPETIKDIKDNVYEQGARDFSRFVADKGYDKISGDKFTLDSLLNEWKESE